MGPASTLRAQAGSCGACPHVWPAPSGLPTGAGAGRAPLAPSSWCSSSHPRPAVVHTPPFPLLPSQRHPESPSQVELGLPKGPPPQNEGLVRPLLPLARPTHSCPELAWDPASPRPLCTLSPLPGQLLLGLQDGARTLPGNAPSPRQGHSSSPEGWALQKPSLTARFQVPAVTEARMKESCRALSPSGARPKPAWPSQVPTRWLQVRKEARQSVPKAAQSPIASQ